MSDPLHLFLEETCDTREYRRAVAVQMARQGIDYATITAVLSVSKAFISKWTGIKAYPQMPSVISQPPPPVPKMGRVVFVRNALLVW